VVGLYRFTLQSRLSLFGWLLNRPRCLFLLGMVRGRTSAATSVIINTVQCCVATDGYHSLLSSLETPSNTMQFVHREDRDHNFGWVSANSRNGQARRITVCFDL